MSIIDFLHKIVDLISNPFSLIVKLNGGIADFYIKYDKKWFHELKIDTVIDIGGNIGQFSKTMRYLLPSANIIAFEPLPDCFIKIEKLMKSDSKFKAFNIGIGDSNSQLTINKSSYLPSSSFLRMSDKHKTAFPQTASNTEATVDVKRLDDVITQLLGDSILIKVDVQGYEAMVIKGGLQTFAKAKVLIMELSFEELYEKQPLFDDIYEELKSLGFKFNGVTAQMPDPISGLFMDADCIFIKNEK